MKTIDSCLALSPELDHNQVFEILEGVKLNVDTSLYSDPAFSSEHMKLIKNFLSLTSLNPTQYKKYLTADIPATNLGYILQILNEWGDVSFLEKIKLNESVLSIATRFDYFDSMSRYDLLVTLINDSYSGEQIEEIFSNLDEGLDVNEALR